MIWWINSTNHQCTRAEVVLQAHNKKLLQSDLKVAVYKDVFLSLWLQSSAAEMSWKQQRMFSIVQAAAVKQSDISGPTVLFGSTQLTKLQHFEVGCPSACWVQLWTGTGTLSAVCSWPGLSWKKVLNPNGFYPGKTTVKYNKGNLSLHILGPLQLRFTIQILDIGTKTLDCHWVHHEKIQSIIKKQWTYN